MRLFPLRRLRGIWVVGMENSSYLPGLNQWPTERQTEKADIWLEAEGSDDPRVRQIVAKGHGTYAIDMLAHVPPFEGSYGHGGIFKHGVLLQRVLSIRPLRRDAL